MRKRRGLRRPPGPGGKASKGKAWRRSASAGMKKWKICSVRGAAMKSSVKAPNTDSLQERIHWDY